MLILTLIAVFSPISTALARRYGASRRIAFGVSTLPALAGFVFCAIRSDLEIGPHGGIVPAWIVAGLLLLVVAFSNFLAVRLVGKRAA